MAKANKKKFSIEEGIRFGWDSMKENYRVFLTLLFVNVIIYIIRWAVEWNIKQNDYVSSIIVGIVFYVIYAAVALGTYNAMLLLAKGKKVSTRDLFSKLYLLPQYLVTNILYILIVAGGLILLIVPGIIWAVKFQYNAYILIEKKVGPIDALKRSANITKGNISNLFLFNLVLDILNIAGALCLLVGLFITIPTTMIARAYVYKKLSAK